MSIKDVNLGLEFRVLVQEEESLKEDLICSCCLVYPAAAETVLKRTFRQ